LEFLNPVPKFPSKNSIEFSQIKSGNFSLKTPPKNNVIFYASPIKRIFSESVKASEKKIPVVFLSLCRDDNNLFWMILLILQWYEKQGKYGKFEMKNHMFFVYFLFIVWIFLFSSLVFDNLSKF
jgi:hypothetical protein